MRVSEPARRAERFVSFDVETANFSMASICQLGVVLFENRKPIQTWESLVDPEDFFEGLNVSIHGIDEDAVQGAPTLPEVYDDLRRRLEGMVVACHTHFDRVSLARARDRYKLPPIECNWLDTARVVRRAWNQFSRRGYGLKCICDFLEIRFEHHRASEDARASGEILIRAMTESNADIEDWLRRVRRPITSPTLGPSLTRDGNPEGPLWGEVLAFTGALTMPRREAADRAGEAGCRVVTSVSKKTTLLVVGDQDISKLAGHQRSRKQRAAEELIREGVAIRILGETDFLRLVGEGI